MCGLTERGGWGNEEWGVGVEGGRDESFYRKLPRQSELGMWRIVQILRDKGAKDDSVSVGRTRTMCVFPCHNNTRKIGLLNQMNSLGF